MDHFKMKAPIHFKFKIQGPKDVWDVDLEVIHNFKSSIAGIKKTWTVSKNKFIVHISIVFQDFDLD